MTRIQEFNTALWLAIMAVAIIRIFELSESWLDVAIVIVLAVDTAFRLYCLHLVRKFRVEQEERTKADEEDMLL